MDLLTGAYCILYASMHFIDQIQTMYIDALQYYVCKYDYDCDCA